MDPEHDYITKLKSFTFCLAMFVKLIGASGDVNSSLISLFSVSSAHESAVLSMSVNEIDSYEYHIACL